MTDPLEAAIERGAASLLLGWSLSMNDPNRKQACRAVAARVLTTSGVGELVAVLEDVDVSSRAKPATLMDKVEQHLAEIEEECSYGGSEQYLGDVGKLIALVRKRGEALESGVLLLRNLHDEWDDCACNAHDTCIVSDWLVGAERALTYNPFSEGNEA